MKLEFKPIELFSKSIIEGYTKDWALECSDLSFANLFIWGANGKMEYAEYKDTLYIKLNYPPVPTYLWAPIPKRNKDMDYKEAVNIGIEYLREIGVEPTLRSVWEPFKDKIMEIFPEFYASVTDIAWDYVYEREKLATLSGNKYHGKRNHVNKFLSEYPDHEYVKLDDSMIDACLELYKEWGEQKEETSIELFDEKMSVMLALKNREELNLTGACVIVNGRIEAFTLGERLLPNMQLIHIEKGNADIAGIYPYINQQYVLNECEGVELINREEDMGLEGMRRAKRSYRPIKMIEKYFISTKDLTGTKGLWLADA